MTNTPTGMTFLQTISGFAQAVAWADNPSANTPIRLAVIDPSYVASSYPGTLPRVKFEGEDSVTDKRYIVVARDYIPSPGDRVVMLPVGHTYVILGCISPSFQPNLERADLSRRIFMDGTTTVTIGSGLSSATASVSWGHTFNAPPKVVLGWDATTGDSAYPFYTASVDSRTTTGGVIRVAFSTAGTLGASRSIDVDWIAIGT